MNNIKKATLGISVLLLLLMNSLSHAENEAVNYTYDALDRLIGVEYVGKGSISYSYDKAGDITNLTILVVNNASIDIDQDGIADDWEMLFFQDLTTVSATTDFDGDGYSDLWEYLNWKDMVFDSKGGVYSPIIINAPGGRGHNSTHGSILLMLLPAILSAAGK